jgi:hypothetical protein
MGPSSYPWNTSPSSIACKSCRQLLQSLKMTRLVTGLASSLDPPQAKGRAYDYPRTPARRHWGVQFDSSISSARVRPQNAMPYKVGEPHNDTARQTEPGCRKVAFRSLMILDHPASQEFHPRRYRPVIRISLVDIRMPCCEMTSHEAY